jgi:predicted PurR-regulated permease PerM
MNAPPKLESKPGIWLQRGIWVAVACLCVLLVIALRGLIVPITVGALTAYVFRPLLSWLHRNGVSRRTSIGIAMGAFIVLIFYLGGYVRRMIPDQQGQLEMRQKVLIKVNALFTELTASAEESATLRMIVRETKPVVESVNQALSSERENSKEQAQSNVSSVLGDVLSAISLWLISPLVFFFLLYDRGEMRRSIFAGIPNTYFELALAVWADVDEALGRYLRGVLAECALVSLSYLIGLILIGMETRYAIIISLLCGLSCAVPLMGPVVGLTLGVSYALLAEGIHPLLPFITETHFLPAVALVVAAVYALDAIIFQPLVLGSVVNLHPMIIIIGITAGSMIAGLQGMLLAIPAIVVVRVFLTTLQRQLKAHRMV